MYGLSTGTKNVSVYGGARCGEVAVEVVQFISIVLKQKVIEVNMYVNS